jgi:hypothetical protein
MFFLIAGQGDTTVQLVAISDKELLTHSNLFPPTFTFSIPSIDLETLYSDTAIMEGLKNAFAQCKKEGRVSYKVPITVYSGKRS